MLKSFRICSVECFVSNRMTLIRKESYKPNFMDNKYTWVGPPHATSNLRPTVFPTNIPLTVAEKKYHAAHLETQAWNQHYWETHNSEFEKAKDEYIKKYKQKKYASTGYILTTEELSHFYKIFLDKNHKKHMNYNWEWYKRNCRLLYLSSRASLSRMFHFSCKKDV